MDGKRRGIGMKEEGRRIASVARQARGLDRVVEEMLGGKKG